MHSTQYVLFRRLAYRVLLVIGKNDHVLPLVAKVLVQECRHVFDVVDASPQLPSLSKVVYSYQKRLSSPRGVRVLESIILWSTTSK
jgi:hypothetical protein